MGAVGVGTCQDQISRAMDRPLPRMMENSDVLLRTMEFLGPRHVCIGIGATCRNARRLSKCNSLWRTFWEVRCLLPPIEVAIGDTDGPVVHEAAVVFRLGISEMNLAEEMRRSGKVENGAKEPRCEGPSHPTSTDEPTLYSAYVQRHALMKMTNVRVEQSGRRLGDNDLEQSTLRSRLCTQTWPGQLSLVADENTEQNHSVTCLNPAEAWCDHPACGHARCGPQGCLRCYRFLPRDYSLNVGGQLSRECSDRDYDLIQFVKCSWCSVSFCGEHIGRHAKHRTDRQPWYNCEECQKSACPDCVGQVFLSPPDMGGCRVETAGKICRRKVCPECIWYVGKKRHCTIGNVPGGDYASSMEPDIVTARGIEFMDWKRQEHKWEEVETCCSKCLRHLEFRWRELAQVQESFGGFMP